VLEGESDTAVCGSKLARTLWTFPVNKGKLMTPRSTLLQFLLHDDAIEFEAIAMFVSRAFQRFESCVSVKPDGIER
jgi:hypothetical protein